MDLTIYTSDLNGDGEVHLIIPQYFFLDWGQEPPSNPNIRLGYMPGRLEWTNWTTELEPGSEANFSTYWEATFTFQYILLTDYEAGIAIEPVTLTYSGTYYSDTDPGSDIPPVPEYYDPEITYEGADIHVIGTDANDIIHRASGPSWYEYWGSQIIDAGGGDDDLWNLANGLSIINAGSGSDTVYSAAGGQSIIDGGEGDDKIRAKIGDHVDGGAGNDLLEFNFSSASSGIEFKPGEETPILPDASNGNTKITGFEAYDVTFTQYDDILDLRGSNLDSSSSPWSQSQFSMSGGSDTVYIDETASGNLRLWDFDRLIFDISNSDFAGYISYFDIKVGNSLDLSSLAGNLDWISAKGGSARDIFYIDDSDGELFGNGGDDYLGSVGTYGSGTHTFNGGEGDDTLVGGSGTDTAVFSGSYYDYLIDFVAGTISGPDGTDTFERMEFFTFDDGTLDLATGVFDGPPPDAGVSIDGTSGDDLIDATHAPATQPFPTEYDDDIYGYGGDDTLVGGSGEDILDGGTGADTMEGGLDDDTYYVDNVGDIVIEQDGEGTDLVISSISFALSAQGVHVENLTLTGNADLRGIGDGFDNVITGNDGDNFLNGRWGNDTLIGGAGNDTFFDNDGADTMEGGLGDDTFYVDNVGDNVIEFDGEGRDTVITSVNFFLSAQSLFVEDLILSGNADLKGIGNNLDNTITGNDGDNFLNGRWGDDTLIGGGGNDTFFDNSGNDTMYGGTGNDRFVFQNGWGNDTVGDWESGADVLDFTELASLGVHSMSDLTIDVTADGTLISHGADSVLLADYTGTLDASDFDFA